MQIIFSSTHSSLGLAVMMTVSKHNYFLMSNFDLEYIISKVWKLKRDQQFDYFSVPIIQKFMMSIKAPQGIFDPKTREFKREPIHHKTNQTSTLIIKKLNIRGLNKFIWDLDDLVSKICPYCEEFNKVLEPKQVEFIKSDIIKELKDHMLTIEFPNAELEDLAAYVDTKVNKIYQVEFEKELAVAQTTSASNSTSKDAYSSVKKRSAKRRSNMLKSDLHQWEMETLPNQKNSEIRMIYNKKMRKYLDRIKSEIAPVSYSDLILTRDLNHPPAPLEVENPNAAGRTTRTGGNISTSENINPAESSRNRRACNNEEEKKSSIETRPRKKRGPKPKKESVYSKIYKSEEEVHDILVNIFEMIKNMNGCNLYDFILNFIEFPLRRKLEAQKLIYTPNSINFYNLFQKVYITWNGWEKTLPLESLVFLTEITCRNTDFYYGYGFVRDKLFDSIHYYNPQVMEEQGLEESLQVRVWYLLSKYFKDVTHQKIEAVELIEKAQKILLNIKKRVISGTEDYEEIEYESIVLPWVSFQEWITQEKLISLWKDLEMEVDILFFIKPSLKSEKDTLLEKLKLILRQKTDLVEEELFEIKQEPIEENPLDHPPLPTSGLEATSPEELSKIKDQFEKIFSILKKYSRSLFKKANKYRSLELNLNGGTEKEITVFLSQGFPFEYFDSIEIDPSEAEKKLQEWAKGKNIDKIDESDGADVSMDSGEDLSDDDKEKFEESKSHNFLMNFGVSDNESDEPKPKRKRGRPRKAPKEKKPEEANLEAKEESSIEIICKDPLFGEDIDGYESINSDSSPRSEDSSKEEEEEEEEEEEIIKFTKTESERLLSLGFFFLKSMFAMIEDESGNIKDNQSFDSCLKYCRKIFKGVDFDGFMAMFRYLFAKMEILRMENMKTHNSVNNSGNFRLKC